MNTNKDIQEHAQAALSDELPPLPEPRSIKRWESSGRVEELRYHNEEQVREYGRLCLATRQPAPVADPRPLFDRKLADLEQRGYQVIGRILHKEGQYALFDSSCRWLTTPQYQRLMHEQDGSLFAAPVAAAVQGDAKPLAYMHILAEGKFGNEGWNTQFLRSPQEAESERAIHGGTVIQLIDAQPSPAQGDAPDGNWPKDFREVIKGAEDAAHQQGRTAGLEEAAAVCTRDAANNVIRAGAAAADRCAAAPAPDTGGADGKG